MKRIVCALLVLSLAGLARAQDNDAVAEGKVKALLAAIEKTLEKLQSVKDKDSAEKAKPDLVKLFAEVDRLGRDFDKVSAEEKKKLEPTYKPKFNEAKKRYHDEVERLRKDAAIMKVLADVGPFKEKDRTALALLRAQQLTTAAQAYKVKNGEYPPTLEELTQGEKPFVEKSALVDPWGKQYQYDPAGKKNKGLKPDIWTVEPAFSRRLAAKRGVADGTADARMILVSVAPSRP